VFYEQGVPGITCASPVYDAAHNLHGVFTVDFDLNALSDFTSHLISLHSDLFVFTSDGLLLAHPRKRVVTQTGQRGEGQLLRLSDAADPLVDAFAKQFEHRRAMATAGASSTTQQNDRFRTFKFEVDGAEYLASATTFHMGDDLTWIVGALAPESDFLGNVHRSQNIALGISIAAVVFSLICALILARRVSGPILNLIGFMQRVGKGDLDARAEFKGSREFRQLSRALNSMITDLRDHVRLRDSMQIASDVQKQLLPMNPPKVDGLDIAGHNTYCDETGGDYYDFLLPEGMGPKSVMLVIGDVVGHGVGAALVMAGIRAVLRDRATPATKLGALMPRLNRLLFTDLSGTSFMTMHLSVVNAQAGVFQWVSAGHDPALIYDPERDEFTEMDKGDLPLGVIEDASFQQHIYEGLRAGQIITVGTDGIWEARNDAGAMFGKERLRSAIRESASRSAAEISQTILDRLTSFRCAGRPTDDITYIVVKILG
jgi:serine phosphatase RsbU (regulator of sigma subunit)